MRLPTWPRQAQDSYEGAASCCRNICKALGKLLHANGIPLPNQRNVPSIHLAQEYFFYREQRKWKSGDYVTKFYSEVLVNSICAVGASLTSRHCVELPELLVDFSAFRERARLDVELNSLTLSTIESLAILSGVESIRMLDARGWLYSGMAVRLATDLGLYLDNQVYVDAGIIHAEEATLQRVVFWAS